MTSSRVVLIAPFALVVAACGDGHASRDGSRAEPVDPATVLALEAPLLSDPDLTSQSRQFQVMSDPGPVDPSLPPEEAPLRRP